MKSVLIIGSGKRVQEAALPALLRLADTYRVEGVLARSERELVVEGTSFAVEPLVDLDQERLDRCDLVYMVVGKGAVPTVLRTLCELDVSRVDLLIDTPVLLFKHMGHLRLLDRFKQAWVPEDCTTLPVFDAIDALLAGGAIGELRRVELDRSGYAYHALAIGRRLLGAGHVRSARRRRLADGRFARTFRFERPGELYVIEPRDYAVGRITLEGTHGSLSDDPEREPTYRLSPRLEQGACIGFEIDGASSDLTADERALMGTPLESGSGTPGVTVWMEGMKRVGFLRLLQHIAGGGPGYALADAIEDTIVDYHLEKVGRYFVNPLTSGHLGSARWFMRVLTRVTGG